MGSTIPVHAPRIIASHVAAITEALAGADLSAADAESWAVCSADLADYARDGNAAGVALSLAGMAVAFERHELHAESNSARAALRRMRAHVAVMTDALGLGETRREVRRG